MFFEILKKNIKYVFSNTVYRYVTKPCQCKMFYLSASLRTQVSVLCLESAASALPHLLPGTAFPVNYQLRNRNNTRFLRRHLKTQPLCRASEHCCCQRC